MGKKRHCLRVLGVFPLKVKYVEEPIGFAHCIIVCIVNTNDSLFTFERIKNNSDVTGLSQFNRVFYFLSRSLCIIFWRYRIVTQSSFYCTQLATLHRVIILRGCLELAVFMS